MSIIWDGGVFIRMLRLNTWRLLVIFVSNKLNRAIIFWEATIKPAMTNVAHCRIRIAHAFTRRIAHEPQTYRTHVAHGSHTDRTFIAHISHTYRTHCTHFWLSLLHSAMTSVLFQVRRLNFMLQTCLISRLNSQNTHFTCYWMFKYTINVHSEFTIYRCLEISQ